MTPFPWRRGDVVAALRDRLLTRGSVTDGFTGVDVLPVLPGGPADEDGVVVLFRWERDPATYAVRFPLEPPPDGEGTGGPPGVSTGVPTASLEGWVAEVVLWLTEELGTGLVRRSARTQVGDAVLLAGGVDAVDVLPAGWYIGDVHLGPDGDGGDHLRRVGLSTRVARRLREQDRLLAWLHAYADNARGEPFVGHAVVSGGPPGSARLEVLEVVRGTPATVAAALAFHAVRGAVEAGAGAVVTALDDSALDEIGFHPHGGGGRVVGWDEVRPPDVGPR